MKKRSRKAYTKKSKKIEEEALNKVTSKNLTDNAALSGNDMTTNSVRFCAEDEIVEINDDSVEANNDCTALNDVNVARLTNKKKQYL